MRKSQYKLAMFVYICYIYVCGCIWYQCVRRMVVNVARNICVYVCLPSRRRGECKKWPIHTYIYVCVCVCVCLYVEGQKYTAAKYVPACWLNVCMCILVGTDVHEKWNRPKDGKHINFVGTVNVFFLLAVLLSLAVWSSKRVCQCMKQFERSRECFRSDTVGECERKRKLLSKAWNKKVS